MNPLTEHRGLGWNVKAEVAHWDRTLATTKTVGAIFGASLPPRRSPDVRRFHHGFFWSQRQRGFCVGFNLTATGMTLIRIPHGATDGSKPLSAVKLSPLATYDGGRLQAIADGYAMDDQDGAFGGEAAKWAAGNGFCLWDDDPAEPASIDAHRNGTRLTAKQIAAGKHHLLKDYALCESFGRGLELNAGGFPVCLCSPIPDSMMATNAKGRFRMVGPSIGGHCYLMLDHDRDANTATIAQAWEYWGEKTTDPTYADRHGYTQIGSCPLDELERWFAPSAMANGESQIIVLNTIDGFAPKINFDGFAPEPTVVDGFAPEPTNGIAA